MTVHPPPIAAIAGVALDEARADLLEARRAADAHDVDRQNTCAQSAIDHATTTLIAPEATPRQVVAAHFVVAEGLALEGRRGQGGTDRIDTEAETAALRAEDRQWLENYLAATRARRACRPVMRQYGREL